VGFGIERKKRENRKALIINKLKGIPGGIKNDARCLMRTKVANWNLSREVPEVHSFPLAWHQMVCPSSCGLKQDIQIP
jgi:hypothetical protein